MSVRLDQAGTILLAGDCTVEEAETLLGLLLTHPDAAVDWSAAKRLHTALVQVLFALQPVTRGTCRDPFLASWLPAAIGHGATRAS